MTDHQDLQRAGLRALMADSGLEVPDYAADAQVLGRVGGVIGATATDDERYVRASDSSGRLSTEFPEVADYSKGLNIWLWSASICTIVCTVGLGIMLYDLLA
jgi:hypothetical protein